MPPVFGASVRRVEDPRLVRGEGCYVDDFTMPGCARLVFLRTQVAHARITKLDLEAVRTAPGVLKAWTASDLAELHPMEIEVPVDGMPVPERRLLAEHRVRHFGEAVGMIVAESDTAARDALELAVLDLEPLPAMTDVQVGLEPDAPLVYPEFGTNRAFSQRLKHGQVKRAFDRASVVIRRTLRNQRLIPSSIEPRGAVAWADDGRLMVQVSSQAPHIVRDHVAHVLGLEAGQVRVLVKDVGGGFGSKGGALAEEIAVAFAAWQLKRPVKWIEERWENCAVTYHGRGQLQEVELAATREGKVLGIRSRILADMGAHLEPFTAFVATGTPSLQTGCYDISASQNELIGVYTTTTPTGPYRGAGRPEAAYLIERMMDELAAEIGTDPAEVRRLNFIPKSAFPYTNPGDMTYDSGDYGRTLDRVLALADYPALRASQAAARREGRLQGIGLSTYVESAAGFGTDQATMRLEPDGRLTVITGSTPHGQGHETTWAQIAADQFGVPLEQVAVVYGDTDAPSYAEGTFGSRSAAVSGMAVRQAAVALKKRIRRLAADQFEAAAADVVLEEGRVFVRGVPSRALSLAQVAMAAGGNGKADRLSVEASYEPPDSVYPFGAHLAHVEIDPESGAIKVLRYIAVDDCGRVINPMIVEGQVHGGITQGLAQALFEEAIFDPDGQLLTGNLTTYLMPTAPDTPSFETDRTETPSPNNAMGVKGIGEGATIGSTPAVVNAVMDALRPLGIRHLDMPLTPFKIWQALQPVDT